MTSGLHFLTLMYLSTCNDIFRFVERLWLQLGRSGGRDFQVQYMSYMNVDC